MPHEPHLYAGHDFDSSRHSSSIPLQQVLDKLTAELKAQQRNAAVVMQRLSREADSWLRRLPTLRHTAETFVLHW